MLYKGEVVVSVPFQDAYGKDEDDLVARATACLRKRLGSDFEDATFDVDAQPQGEVDANVTVTAEVRLVYETKAQTNKGESPDEMRERLLENDHCVSDMLDALGLSETEYDDVWTMNIEVEVEDDSVDDLLDDVFDVSPEPAPQECAIGEGVVDSPLNESHPVGIILDSSAGVPRIG